MLLLSFKSHFLLHARVCSWHDYAPATSLTMVVLIRFILLFFCCFAFLFIDSGVLLCSYCFSAVFLHCIAIVFAIAIVIVVVLAIVVHMVVIIELLSAALSVVSVIPTQLSH
ncbi:unnamed protein product [Ceratitis capitata]|uniref:(Mediterranean fruit fly) hypothetical protein n=1 Tax=Ceratitis capitata TaxID=7213 RepID=A0A811VBR2_CERCA|nr:unnamed protein product [Ceratitis capitata]